MSLLFLKPLKFAKETMSTAADFPDLSGKQVLIVDDNDDSLELIAFILEECQVKIIKAKSVADALECLERSRPNLLISDISMPGEDGYVLIAKVKQFTAAQGWHLPVIALSSYATAEEQQRMRVAGFQMRLTKPIDPNDLIAAVMDMLG